MTDATTPPAYAAKIEEAATNGNVTNELHRINQSIKGTAGAAAADRLLQEVTAELHTRGALPNVVRAWAQANFTDLDLDGNGKISAPELKQILQTDLLKNAVNPLERQLLRYLQANRAIIAAAKNDEWGTESSITKEDLTEHEKQAAIKNRTAITAKLLHEKFGNTNAYARLDANNDGFLSEAELNNALAGKRGEFNAEERHLVQYLKDNRVAIAKSINDQKLWENKDSRKDIEAFSHNNRVPALAPALSQARDFSEQKPTATTTNANKHLPDLVLDFGKEHFAALDLNGDGKLTRPEIAKLADSKFWRRGISEDNMRLMSVVNNKLEYMQRSHRDELWYKDRHGVSVKDLEAYAKFEAQNRRDLPTTPGDHKLELTIGGVKRDYTMHIPPGYDGSKPMPIVYMFHYFRGNSEEMAKTSELSKKADKEGFIVIYPNAQGWLGTNLRQWNLNNNADYRVDEVAFVETMMNTTEAKLNIDKDRVFIAGYSNGGMLAQEIAAKLSDRVAAMTCVGGCQNGKEPNPEYAVATMLIHGRKDRIVPAGGRLITPLFPRFKPLEHARDFWNRANGTDTAVTDTPALGILRETYTNSKTGKQVIVYRHNEGHCYPGDPQPTLDGKPCLEINATDLMWDFFKQNKRTAPAKPSQAVSPVRK